LRKGGIDLGANPFVCAALLILALGIFQKECRAEPAPPSVAVISSLTGVLAVN
jgi:hypothetical protein